MNYDGTIKIAVGESRKSVRWQNKELKWSELVARLAVPERTQETVEEYSTMPKAKRDEVKDVGGFVGGLLKGGRRKADAIASRRLMTLDFDFVPQGTDIWPTVCLDLGCAGVLYTTHSHTTKEQRYRFVAPFDRNVTPDEYEPIARRIGADFGINMLDDTTYEPHRLFYWPSCPRDAEYRFEVLDGPWLCADEQLARYENWRDPTQWPVSSRQQGAVKAIAKKQGDPTAKSNIVGAFCRVYDIHAVIENFLPDTYIRCEGEDRYTYAAGSTTGGLVIYEDAKFAFSHHGTDPTCGMLCNSFDFARVHIFGYKDKDAPEETPTHLLPSYRDMCELAMKDEAVRKELAEAFEDASPGAFRPTDFSDAGNAEIFTRRYKDELFYVDAAGWYFWDEQRWARGDHVAAEKMIALTRAMLDDALGEHAAATKAAAEAEDLDDDARTAVKRATKQAVEYLKHAQASRNEPRIRRALVLSNPALHRKLAELDADPFALCTPAGVVDLETGQVRAHDPKELVTKITEAAPGADGADMWAEFINTITCDDKALAAFLQEVAGMAAIGAVYHEGIIVAYGGGRNGKSTFWNALGRVLGDYAGNIAVDALTTDRTNKGASLATLRGKRLVLTGELEEGKRLSVSMLKRLASTDTLVAEEKFKQPEEFVQSHTLALFTNHLPRVGSTDEGTWRRLTLVPFNATISTTESKQKYSDILVDKAGPAILSWVIEGAVNFVRNGFKLSVPDAVTAATQEYRTAEDWLGNFISERCVKGDRVGARELYTAYRDWAEECGDFVRRENDFARELEAAGYRDLKVGGRRFWIGLKVDYGHVFDEKGGAGWV